VSKHKTVFQYGTCGLLTLMQQESTDHAGASKCQSKGKMSKVTLAWRSSSNPPTCFVLLLP